MLNLIYPLKLIPEWEMPVGLFIVWPHKLNASIDTLDVIENYCSLIAYIPPEIGLNIIVSKKTIIQQARATISNAGIKRSITFLEIDTINDIWIKDFAPVPAQDQESNRALVKSLYRPRYLGTTEAREQHMAGIAISSSLNEYQVEIPLVWDIGNLTHNGHGTAIVTRRILSDNGEMTIREIREIFRDILGINQLITIEEFPGDITGHIDWLVRFIDPVTVAVAEFPGSCVKENRFMERVIDRIEAAAKPWIKIIRVMNSFLVDPIDDEFPNSFGNHLNFLRLGPNRILMPVYGVSSDKIAIAQIKRFYPRYQINAIDARAISLKGGVLNCMTWLQY